MLSSTPRTAAVATQAAIGPKPPAIEPEEFIATVDVWQLSQFRWPIMRLLTRDYVERLELGGYLARLLATGRWRDVHAVPHAAGRHAHQHLFDVYGRPRSG